MTDLRQISLRQRSLLDIVGTRSLTAAGLAEGTNVATIKTTNTLTFLIGGAFYSKAATDNITPSAPTGGNTYVTQTALSTAYYVAMIDTAGTVKLQQGLDTLANKVAGRELPGELPLVPTGYVPFGVIKVVLAGAATFLPGTTDLSAASVTATKADVSCLPLAVTDLTFA